MRFRNEDQLFRLQLRVAQRADELARIAPTGGSARRDRETWRRAEAELLPALATATTTTVPSAWPQPAAKVA